MNTTLQISRRVDYALRACICLAELPQHSVLSFRDIAALERIPEDFLAKILSRLVKAQLISSTRGPRGGYKLRHLPKDITFLQIIQATDGPILLNPCLHTHQEVQNDDPPQATCEALDICSMHTVWQRAQNALTNVFHNTTLEDVIRPERVCDNLIRLGQKQKTKPPQNKAKQNA